MLTGRALAYALIDDPLARHAAGRPAAAVVIVVSAVLALASRARCCGSRRSASTSAGCSSRERARAAPARRALVPRAAALLRAQRPRLRAARVRSLHWRAGLGFHGLDCLLGPVHRDALPILAALRVIVAAPRRRRAGARGRLDAPHDRGAARAAPRAAARPGAAALVLAPPLAAPRRRPLGARGPPLVVA